jgi:hypothetical protein
LAADEADVSLKKRYADLTECYRLRAQEPKRLISEAAIAKDRTKSGHAA